MWQLRIEAAFGNSFPISIVCRYDGCIIFYKSRDVGYVSDQHPDGVSAEFDDMGFKIGNEEYTYLVAYPYKEHESMWKWLAQQQMIFPDFMKG